MVADWTIKKFNHLIDKKKRPKGRSNSNFDTEYNLKSEDFKLWNPFNIKDILAERKERIKRYPNEFERKAMPSRRSELKYNLLNKPWSPSPGRSHVVEDLQAKVINYKIKRRSKKKSRSKSKKSKHNRVPQTANQPRRGSKVYTQNKRFTNKSYKVKNILSRHSKNSKSDLSSLSFQNHKYAFDAAQTSGKATKIEVKFAFPELNSLTVQ
mmetsp:Transcript_5251/g.4434  ORF Transcript_5251/g.4434 Transcript_5251/m.4434 type:complete len:210 (+) Transcript_5251:462-1091(+)